jgi:hypothetical protein
MFILLELELGQEGDGVLQQLQQRQVPQVGKCYFVCYFCCYMKLHMCSA